MTDDQSFLATLLGLFWLLSLLIGMGIGRLVNLRIAILVACALLLILLLGAAWAYLENRGRAYGAEFMLTAYLVFVAIPVLGFGVIGLSLGQFWRRKAGGL